MIMDAKDIQSDLHALKRLYGLLKIDGDSTSNSATDLLDEHARVLLKKLLDAETIRVLKEHSEIIAGTISATQLQPTPLSKFSITAQSREKEMESDKDRKVDGLDIAFWKEKRIFPPPVQSVLASGLEQKKKRCRLCQRNTINHMEPIEETHFYVDAQNLKRFTDMKHQENNESYHDLFNSHHETRPLHDTAKLCSSDIEATGKPEDVDWLSKEASEAIEQIESCISALHIQEDHSHMFEENSQTQCVNKSQIEEGFMSRSKLAAEEMNQPYWLLNQTSNLAQPTKAMLTQSTNNFMSSGLALGSDAPGELGESIEECKFPREKLNNIHGQNVKAIIEKIEPGNWIMHHYDFVPSRMHNVQNFSAQLDPSETSYRNPTWPPTFTTASKLEGPFQSHMALEDECTTHRLFQTDKPSWSFLHPNNSEKIQSVDSGLKVSSSLRARGNKDEIRKNRQYITARSTFQQQESDGTASDSYSNSTTQQTSSRGSDSEEYSLTDQTGEYVTSSIWSESGASPLSYRTESNYNSYTGNIEDDVYSSTSSVADRELISSASSKSKGHSSYDEPTSKKSGPIRPRKAKVKNRNKQIGMWKRMKDKMAIIFHHHHHHHHHHHDDRGKNKIKMSRNSSLLKHKVKDMNFNRQDEEAYGEKAVEKMKSIVLEKNQQRHFHGLMEGLLRHVRRSKQSKTGKETIGKLGKGEHGRQKSLKKSHWWKLLQHHRRRKLPNKTHVKLGLGKKKARLKTLPNLN